MDIVKPSVINPVGEGGRGDAWLGGGRAKPKPPPAKTEAAGASGAPGREIGEAYRVSVLGIPIEQLTAEVDKAIETLMAEIGMLRAEAQRLRERVALLESETDHHPLLPILSQRAFMRQLAHVIEHVGQLPSPACLLILSVANGDAIRQRFGLAIRDQAIKHLVEVAKGVLLPTDVLGGLGGNDLGIILIVAGEPVARERARHLREAIAARPFAWQSQPVPLEIACGIVLLDAGVTPASALVMADGDLRASRTQVPAPP